MATAPLTAEAQRQLRQTSTAALLRTAYALTHRIAATDDGRVVGELRQQRDAIDAELIRRAGE